MISNDTNQNEEVKTMDTEKEIRQLKIRIHDLEKAFRIQNWTIRLIIIILLIRALDPVLKDLM